MQQQSSDVLHLPKCSPKGRSPESFHTAFPYTAKPLTSPSHHSLNGGTYMLVAQSEVRVPGGSSSVPKTLRAAQVSLQYSAAALSRPRIFHPTFPATSLLKKAACPDWLRSWTASWLPMLITQSRTTGSPGSTSIS